MTLKIDEMLPRDNARDDGKPNTELLWHALEDAYRVRNQIPGRVHVIAFNREQLEEALAKL